MPPKANSAQSTSTKQSGNKPNIGRVRQTPKEEPKDKPTTTEAQTKKEDATAATTPPRRSARNAGKVPPPPSSEKQSKSEKSTTATTKPGQKRSRSTKAEDNNKPSKQTEDVGNDNEADTEPKKKKPKTTTTAKDSVSKEDAKKTIGSKHDKATPPAQQGSNTRLPKKGQTAHWKAMPGWVEGTVVEILTASKSVDGKQVKATKDEPRVVLKSSAKSGKICVHKPDNVYFDD